MNLKPRVDEIIVVEGRYDKNALSQVVDAVIIETSGFGIYKNTDKTVLIRKLAAQHGVIVLTDGDSAGFQIRAYLKSKLAGLNIKHAYIPDLQGRERRKKKAGKAGLIGVEGMPPETLLQALRDCGATIDGTIKTIVPDVPVSAVDFYALGLTGADNSRQKRSMLLKKLELPEQLSVKGLIAVVNCMYGRDEFIKLAEETLCRELQTV